MKDSWKKMFYHKINKIVDDPTEFYSWISFYQVAVQWFLLSEYVISFLKFIKDH